MPYEIIKQPDGSFKVCKLNNPKKCFSKKGLTLNKAKKQLKAIEISEHKLKGGMRPLMSRIGGKNYLKKEIVNNYFLKDYQNMTYVEPFVGGGSIFFYKKPSIEEIINDKDSKLINLYKGFQKYDGEKISNSVDGKYNKEKFNEIKNSNPKSQYDKFIKNLILHKTSFFGLGRAYGARKYIKSNYKKYKDRLKNVKILNEDYKDIIKKYDSPNTFFYLDPPYENSKNLYENYYLPIKDVYDLLKNIKGKFLISYNNSEEAKKLFKDYNINYIKTTYVDPIKGGNNRDVKEMLISNYDPKLEGGKRKMTKEEIEAYNAKLEEERKKREANKGPIKCPVDRLYDPNKEYKGNENVCIENKDGTITYVDLGKMDYEPCFIGKNFYGHTSPEECKRLNKEAFAQWEKENHPENYYFFRPALKAITKVGDLLVDTVPMPDIVKDVYKGAREATKDSIEGFGKPLDEKLYNKIKKEVYKKNPKHSLYRSALIQKIYQSEGGEYEEGDKPKMNIKKWFKQLWVSLPDYLNGDIVQCGNSKLEGIYPLCRPLAIAEKLSKSEIKKMIKEKNELKEKPLRTEKVINRKDVNIKPTNTGLGKSKFQKQLEKLNITQDEYLDYACKIAKLRGYDPKKLQLANDDKHKLIYNGVKFGAVGYNDFILYLHQVKEGKIPFEYAIEKMKNYRKRAENIKGDWKKDKESPNNLAINILW